MKLYKITDRGIVHWFTNKDHAKQVRQQIIKAYGDAAIIESVVFPVAKRAIVDWLNNNACRS